MQNNYYFAEDVLRDLQAIHLDALEGRRIRAIDGLARMISAIEAQRAESDRLKLGITDHVAPPLTAAHPGGHGPCLMSASN